MLAFFVPGVDPLKSDIRKDQRSHRKMHTWIKGK
jgi:hypothetical protein